MTKDKREWMNSMGPDYVSDERETDACAVIGRMILLGARLDDQLSRVLIEVLALEHSPSLLSIVATLDTSRKLEVLKAQCRHMPEGDWKKGLSGYLKDLGRANTTRNTVAHSMLVVRDGELVLTSNAAAKMLKSLDQNRQKFERVRLENVRQECARAEQTYATGENVLENFERSAEAFRTKRKLKHAARESHTLEDADVLFQADGEMVDGGPGVRLHKG